VAPLLKAFITYTYDASRRPPAHRRKGYSPNVVVEDAFSEVRLPLYGVLRGSAIIQNQDVGKGPSRVRIFFASYASACIFERVWVHSTTTKKIG
jgi:hypothetical protein